LARYNELPVRLERRHDQLLVLTLAEEELYVYAHG
jgi:hypothetical protein